MCLCPLRCFSAAPTSTPAAIFPATTRFPSSETTFFLVTSSLLGGCAVSTTKPQATHIAAVASFWTSPPSLFPTLTSPVQNNPSLSSPPLALIRNRNPPFVVCGQLDCYSPTRRHLLLWFSTHSLRAHCCCCVHTVSSIRFLHSFPSPCADGPVPFTTPQIPSEPLGYPRGRRQTGRRPTPATIYRGPCAVSVSSLVCPDRKSLVLCLVKYVLPLSFADIFHVASAHFALWCHLSDQAILYNRTGEVHVSTSTSSNQCPFSSAGYSRIRTLLNVIPTTFARRLTCEWVQGL